MIKQLVSSGFVRRFAAFFTGSLVGLIIDIGGFWALSAAGVPAALANVASSSCAVVTVYVLVTRYAFRAERSVANFSLFVGWYGLNIAVTSGLIGLAVHTFGPPAIIWKLCSVPLSFGANYAFSHLVFRPDTRGRSRLAH